MVTETTKRALEIIRDHHITMPHQFARFMWPDNPAWSRTTKAGVRGGGMNLAGGGYLGKLRKWGLITGGFNGMVAHLTSEGWRAITVKK